MKILINNLEFNVNGTVYNPFWKDLNSGEWEQETFEIIDYFVSDNSKTLDIGCWAGPISLYMAAKGAQVYSIDPDPIAYEIFIENLKLNPSLNVQIHPFNLAITSKNQYVNLYARKVYGYSSSSILKRSRDTVGNICVKGICFDEFIRLANLKRIDFIKMDIEGGEFEVLPDIIPAMEKLGLPTIYISFHYSQLNEYIYQKKIRLKYFSIPMMKVEQLLGFNLFKTTLRSTIRRAIQLAAKYKFIYDETGNQIQSPDLNPDLLLTYKLNLVLTNKKWIKQKMTKIKRY
jgi:FkbM family methyltransferase